MINHGTYEHLYPIEEVLSELDKGMKSERLKEIKDYVVSPSQTVQEVVNILVDFEEAEIKKDGTIKTCVNNRK